MCPSTEATDAQSDFAAQVLRKLLRHIETENQAQEHYTFLVSHAWTDGPTMYIVYKSPPSDITLGLVRDTRESNIGPGPWLSLDEAVTYYYITDFEEGAGPSTRPFEPGTILWHGFPLEQELPERPSEIPDTYRYTPSTGASSAKRDRDETQRIVNQPRRYADPL